MIRKYKTEDIDAVIEVWGRSNALAHPFLPADFVAQGTKDMRTIYLPNAETWVLEISGQVAGFISLIGNEIGGLFLDPAQIGNGHGRALVDFAVELKGPLRVEVFKDNAIGLPFYEHYGFVLEEAYMHEPSGSLTYKMAMPSADLHPE